MSRNGREAPEAVFLHRGSPRPWGCVCRPNRRFARSISAWGLSPGRRALFFRFVETARPNSSRLRSCARLPGEDLVLIGDLFSQSASRRSTTRTAANWNLPDGWGG